MPPKCEPLCQFSQRLFFTTFPHPAPNPTVLNRLAAEPGNQPQVRARGRPFATSAASDENASYYYFTIDDQLLYFSFFQDWGPLNIAMVYKACILIHELLEDADLAPHRLVLYSSNDPRRKANAALLMALFVMIVQRRAPWEAFHPIAEMEFMPFRDAGRGPSDFNLNIQDCLWGIWKAMQNGLCDMNEFDVEDYEFYEKVENGDWNWITPNFIAFASPVDTCWVKGQKEARDSITGSSTAEPPTSSSSALSSSTNSNLALQRKLPTPFLNCLDYFERKNVKLVIRLNTELYDSQTFLDHGIDHMELYFDDGTNPTDEIVRKFIDVVDRVVEGDGAIAVHCKAGLGRTGTLIGAYLIWKYGFTANEAIAFMRIVRPGSVVGPQQQYMYLKQLEWNKWAAVDEIQRLKAAESAPALVTPATPPAETDEEMMVLPDDVRMTTPPRAEKETITAVTLPPVTPSRHVAAAAAKAKEIATPGQPRKTPNAKRVVPLEFDDIEQEDEEEGADTLDELPSLKPVPLRKQTAPASLSSTSAKGKNTTPSEKSAAPKPTTRVTRSNAGARKAAPSAPASPVKKTPAGKVTGTPAGPRPNKIPRLAAKSGGTSKDVTQSDAPASPAKRKAGGAGQPTPSRLPTLTNKRPPPNATKEATRALTDMAQLKKSGATARQPKGDWVTTHAREVVTPGDRTAGSRPGLRPIRRRRSSFSSADVVA